MKKGFTLIELLGVIVILGIIGLIVVPVIQTSLSDSNQKLCKNQIMIFEKAAKNYVSQNPYGDYDNTDISLETLQNEGFLEESELKNPKGGSFDKTSTVKITYNGTRYTYKYNGTCQD